MRVSEFGQSSSRKPKRSPVPPVEDECAIHQAALLAAVRGERSPSGLPSVPAQVPAMPGCVSTADVAEGIINLKDDPAALSEWANFILETNETTRFRGQESDHWDRLLSSVWEIALGARPQSAVLALAYAIRSRHSWA